MPRMYSATGRSRWPLLVGGLVAVVGLGGGVAFTLTHHDAPDEAAVSPSPTDAPMPSSATADTGVGDDEDGAPPTGCLGGLDRNAAMVLSAQKEAAHTPYGAVEVATAFYRFVWQSPIPTTADIQSVVDDVISPGASASYRDLFGVYRAHPNVSHGDVADSLPFHLSTTNGIWMVDPDSTSDQVTVDIAAGYVVDGALSPSKSTFQGFVMRWENGVWRVAGGTQPDGKTLSSGGVRYTGGC